MLSLTRKGGIKLKERIKKLRKELNLTQQGFADKLGLKRQTIAAYEIGKIVPSDSTLLLICEKFSIRKEWLQNGNGDMRKKRSKNQEIGSFMNDIMDLPDNAFKKRFIETIQKLDENDWEALEQIANKISKEG